MDGRGRPVGLDITDQLLQNMGALRSDGNIQPLPVLEVAKITLPGGDVAVVEVQPSDLPPVRYKGQIWIRLGPRKAIASEQEERILIERRIAQARTFDAQPCSEATIDDLNEDQFLLGYRKHVIAEDVIAANGRSVSRQLASLRFFDPKRHCPTNAGILLFAQRPVYFLPGAYVQFLRLAGNDPASDVLDAKEIEGDLLTVLQTLDLLVDVNIHQRPVFVFTLKETMVPDYPKTAVRELLLNAVMHRNYQSNTPIRFYPPPAQYVSQTASFLSGGLAGDVARTPKAFLICDSSQQSHIRDLWIRKLKPLKCA